MKIDGLKNLFVVAAAVGLTGCATTMDNVSGGASELWTAVKTDLGLGDNTPKRIAPSVWSNGSVTVDLSKKGECVVTGPQVIASFDTRTNVVSLTNNKPATNGQFSSMVNVAPNGDVSVKQANSTFKELPKMSETAKVIDRAQKQAVSTAKLCETTKKLEAQFTAKPDPQQDVTVNGVKAERPAAKATGKPTPKPK